MSCHFRNYKPEMSNFIRDYINTAIRKYDVLYLVENQKGK